MKNRRLVLDAHRNLEIIAEEVPKPQKNEVLIRIVANGICGSDVHFFKEGRLGNFVVTEPYTPGHECSGYVAGLGEDVAEFGVGDRVVIEPGIPCSTCLYCKTGVYHMCKKVIFLSAPPINGTFCDYIAVRKDMVFPFSDALTYEQAAFAEPTAVAVHSVNKAGGVLGKDAVIIGSGAIGLLVLQVFKAAGGNKAVMVDMLDNRLEIAKGLGADEVINPLKSNMASNLGDVVFETAGSVKATEILFDVAKTNATVVQVGWPDGNIVPLDVAALNDKELTYKGVNRYANAYPAALLLLANGRVAVDAVITKKFDFENVIEAFNFAANNAAQSMKIIVVNENTIPS